MAPRISVAGQDPVEMEPGLTAGRILAADFGKRPLAAVLNGELVDLETQVGEDSDLAPVLDGSPEGLEILRHSTSHVMAEAVKALFPQAKVAIGPAVKDGFYYDFEVENPFTPEDLPRIEAKMAEIIKADGILSRRRLQTSVISWRNLSTWADSRLCSSRERAANLTSSIRS